MKVIFVIALASTLVLAPRGQAQNKPSSANNKAHHDTRDTAGKLALQQSQGADSRDSGASNHQDYKTTNESKILGLTPDGFAQAAAAVLLAVITGIYVVITGKMLGKIGSQVEIMQKQVENAGEQLIASHISNQAMFQQIFQMRMANEQTGRLIAEARISADAAKESADALVASERAWVMVKVDFNRLLGIDIEDEVKTGIRIDFICRNFGRTPALIDEVCCQLGIFDWFPETIDFASMEPYDSEPQEIRAGKRSEPRIYQPQCLGEKTLDNVLMLYGIVKYRDIFGNKRSTTFGYSVIGSGEVRKLKRLVGKTYNQYK